MEFLSNVEREWLESHRDFIENNPTSKIWKLLKLTPSGELDYMSSRKLALIISWLRKEDISLIVITNPDEVKGTSYPCHLEIPGIPAFLYQMDIGLRDPEVDKDFVRDDYYSLIKKLYNNVELAKWVYQAEVVVK